MPPTEEEEEGGLSCCCALSEISHIKREGGEERDPCSSRNVPNVRGISWPSSLQQPRRKRAVARSYVQKEGQGFDKQEKENRKQTKKIFSLPCCNGVRFIIMCGRVLS